MPSAVTTFSASPFAPRKPTTSGGPTTSAAPAPTTDHADGPLLLQSSLVAAITPAATTPPNNIPTAVNNLSGTTTSAPIAPPEDSAVNRRYIRSSSIATTPFAATTVHRPNVEPQKSDEPQINSKQSIAPLDGRRPSGGGNDQPAGIASTVTAPRPTATDGPVPLDDSTAEQERKSAAAAVAAAAFGGNSPFALGGQSSSSVVPQNGAATDAAAINRDGRYTHPHSRGAYPSPSAYHSPPSAPSAFATPVKGSSNNGVNYVPSATAYSSEHAEGPWSKEEIVGLLHGMMLHGRRWRLLTNSIGSRTSSQVRQKGLSIMSKLNRHFGLQLSSVTSRSSNDLHPMLHEVLKQQQHNFDHLVSAIEPTTLPPEPGVASPPQSVVADQRALTVPKSAFVSPPAVVAQPPPPLLLTGVPSTAVGGSTLQAPPQHHHVNAPTPMRDTCNDKGEPGWERRVQEVNALNKGALPPWSNAFVFPNCTQVAQNLSNSMNTRKRKARKEDTLTMRHGTDMYPDGNKRLRLDGGHTGSPDGLPGASSADHTAAISPNDSDGEKSKFFADLFDQECSTASGHRPINSSSAKEYNYSAGGYYDDEDVSGDCRLAGGDNLTDDDYTPVGDDVHLKTRHDRQRSSARRSVLRRRSEARRRGDGGAELLGDGRYARHNGRIVSDAVNSSSSNTAFQRTRSFAPPLSNGGALHAPSRSALQPYSSAVGSELSRNVLNGSGEYNTAPPSALDDSPFITAAEQWSSSQGGLLSASLLQALEAALSEVQNTNNDDSTTAKHSPDPTAKHSPDPTAKHSPDPTAILPLGANFDARVSMAASWGLLNVSLGLLTGTVDANVFLWTACRASAMAAAAMVDAAHNGVCTGTVAPNDTADIEAIGDMSATDTPTNGLVPPETPKLEPHRTTVPVPAVVAEGSVENSTTGNSNSTTGNSNSTTGDGNSTTVTSNTGISTTGANSTIVSTTGNGTTSSGAGGGACAAVGADEKAGDHVRCTKESAAV